MRIATGFATGRLQALLQRQQRLAETHRSPTPVAVRENQMTQAVTEWTTADADPKFVHMRPVELSHLTRVPILSKLRCTEILDFLLPAPHPTLQRALKRRRVAGIRIAVQKMLQQCHRLQLLILEPKLFQLRFVSLEWRLASRFALAFFAFFFDFTRQFADILVFPGRLAVHA